MFNLILEDLRRSQKITYLLIVYTFILVYAFQSLGNSAYVAIVIAIAYMLISKACAPDGQQADSSTPESAKAGSSAPVQPEDIVAAKYLAIFVYGLLGTAAYLLAASTLHLLNITVATPSLDLPSIAMMFFTLGTMAALYYPLYFTFGYSKTSKYGILLFSVFFLIPPLIMGLIENEMTPQLGLGLLQWLQVQSSSMLALFLILLTLLIMTLSLRYSQKAYSKTRK